jgi:hypothetical protein
LISRVLDHIVTGVTAAAAVGVIDVAACFVAKDFVDAAISVIVDPIAAFAIDDRDALRPGLFRR